MSDDNDVRVIHKSRQNLLKQLNTLDMIRVHMSHSELQK